MKRYVIIVAGGSGSRMGADIPKQFLTLAGRPILMHTVKRFADHPRPIDIILVLPDEFLEYWQRQCSLHKFDLPHKIASGGSTRFQSVKNGLKMIEEEGLVGIHDGVRPFVSRELIDRCYDTAEQFQTAVPVINIKDSMRKIDREKAKNHNVDRAGYVLIQTPQVFHTSIIKAAYEHGNESGKFTDDASVAEQQNNPITLVDGNEENIKITTPFDLLLAETIILNRDNGGIT